MTTTQTHKRSPMATILIVLGAIFLIGQVLDMGDLWPFFIILPGVPFLYAASKADGADSGLIFPGLMISGTGVILLVQNVTGHWESWAYIWALYPAMIGYGLVFMGRRIQDRTTARVGETMLRWSLIALMAMAIFFEALIFGIGSFLGWPAIFIGVGIWLWMKHGSKFNNTDDQKRKHDDMPEKRKNDLVYQDDERMPV